MKIEIFGGHEVLKLYFKDITITRRKITILLLFRTYKIYEWYLGGCHPIWQPHRSSLSVNRWKVGGVSQKGLIASVKSERNNKKGFYTLCDYLFFLALIKGLKWGRSVHFGELIDLQMNCKELEWQYRLIIMRSS